MFGGSKKGKAPFCHFCCPCLHRQTLNIFMPSCTKLPRYYSTRRRGERRGGAVSVFIGLLPGVLAHGRRSQINRDRLFFEPGALSSRRLIFKPSGRRNSSTPISMVSVPSPLPSRI